jgi:hypothetical protein
MYARDDQVLIAKIKSLPPKRRAEVEDFVDFLKSREDEHAHGPSSRCCRATVG